MRPMHVGSLVLICLLQSACSADVVERANETHPARDAGTHDTGSGGGGGDAPTGRFVPGTDGLDDSGTLSVTVSVSTYTMSGESKDQAPVGLSVTVNEWESWAPVADAEVMGGPLGDLATLTYDPYTASSYFGSKTGYERSWAFSVVRGEDHLKGVLLFGPSYQTLSVTPSLRSATVSWSPSQESDVRAVACAQSEDPANLAEACAEDQDGGSLVLASSNAGSFPDSPYTVGLTRNTKAPIGLGGVGIVAVGTALQVR